MVYLLNYLLPAGLLDIFLTSALHDRLRTIVMCFSKTLCTLYTIPNQATQYKLETKCEFYRVNCKECYVVDFKDLIVDVSGSKVGIMVA